MHGWMDKCVDGWTDDEWMGRYLKGDKREKYLSVV